MEEENNNLNKPEDKENVSEETPASEDSTAPDTATAAPPDDDEDDYEGGEATVKSVSIKWGVILGIISIAVFILGVMGDLTTEQWWGWLGAIPLIIVMVLAHKEFKNEGNGYMSYSQGLGIGIFLSVVSGLVSGLFQLLYTTVIDPDFASKIMEKMEDQWAEQGLTDSQIDTARGFVENFQNPVVGFFIGLVAAAFFGFIIALIVSAITKNSNPEMDV